MATKKVYIGSVGPFLFDDTNLIDDPDGDFPGETQKALVTDGEVLGLGAVSVTELYIYDLDGDNLLQFKVNEDLTGDKTLSFIIGDTDRTITLSGNPTLGDWFNQNVKTTGSPEHSEIKLTPKVSSSGAEGTIFYCSDDNSVYVGTE